MIRFDAVTKQFPGGTTAVDDLTLTAPTGKITVLVGPSGCGKTTSLRMVNRMIEPTRGTITLDGQDTSRMDEAEMRRGIGYVIQHAGLFPHRTVLDNIATVPRLLGWDKKRTSERSRELLDRVGLAPELGDRYPAQLSGGQQQRVGVARALAADPPVMLMDEPFSAVDPVVRDQLQDEFLRLQGELGKTIVFVTHDIDEAIKLGDQVAVLRVGGKLAQVAEPSYLLAHPADDFVADFVGRDRGYRALQFQQAPRLPLRSEPSVVIGERPSSSASWLLVVDDERHPLGWVEPARIGQREVTRDDLHRGGTVAREHGSLRGALDAALSSPSRRGVVVDASGALCGTVLAHEVLTVIEDIDRPERDESDPVHGGAASVGADGAHP
ncbi:ABC transporter ATP-binding protein [Oryzobacter telluris]|uniref:ABC transporter ATP-binding protein n=1 Tax=Oryzobacter telluris TaxID=3149179 RepID=UPI00370D5F94